MDKRCERCDMKTDVLYTVKGGTPYREFNMAVCGACKVKWISILVEYLK